MEGCEMGQIYKMKKYQSNYKGESVLCKLPLINIIIFKIWPH